MTTARMGLAFEAAKLVLKINVQILKRQCWLPVWTRVTFQNSKAKVWTEDSGRIMLVLMYQILSEFRRTPKRTQDEDNNIT